MTRVERYGRRDLTYSQWHRRVEPYTRSTLPYVDLDAVEYCHKCGEPLALLELAQDVGQEFKATTVMRKLAAKAGLPAYLVFYKKGRGGIIGFRVRQVYPRYTGFAALTPDEYVSFLHSLRAKHSCGGR